MLNLKDNSSPFSNFVIEWKFAQEMHDDSFLCQKKCFYHNDSKENEYSIYLIFDRYHRSLV